MSGVFCCQYNRLDLVIVVVVVVVFVFVDIVVVVVCGVEATSVLEASGTTELFPTARGVPLPSSTAGYWGRNTCTLGALPWWVWFLWVWSHLGLSR